MPGMTYITSPVVALVIALQKDSVTLVFQKKTSTSDRVYDDDRSHAGRDTKQEEK